jgi:ectoine hydroxylase-related dioxygenase (phytanoyl-CoA dioxygenase family)
MTLLETPLRPNCVLPRLAATVSSREIVSALELAGCAVVENALQPSLLDAIAADLDPWFARACPGDGYFFGRKTKRFSGLFAKAPSTAALALHETILPALESVLLGPPHHPHGECIQLNLTQAIEIGVGEPAQLLHRDDGLFPLPKTFELMGNIMWTLDDFTVENGATRLAPGSHLWPREEIEQYEDGVVSAVAPRGSAIIWMGSLLHGGGENRSNTPRRGVVMSYSLGWLSQAEKLLLSTPPAIARLLPERLSRLLGYQTHKPNLGWLEGGDPFAWLNGEFSELAPAHDNLTPVQNDMMHQYLKAVGRI